MARAALGGELPSRTLSVERRVPSSTIASVLSEPEAASLPFHPGRSDFSASGGLATMAFPRAVFFKKPKLKCWLTYTPNFISLLNDSWLRFRFPSFPGTVSRDGLLSPPPCAESPFASLRCYLSEGSISCYLNRHYPVLITRTGSCARPNSSRRLRITYYDRSLSAAADHQSLLASGS